MLHLRHLTRLLVVVALLATGLSLAVSAPAGAQTTPPIPTVFNFETSEASDTWEVRVTAQALGGCTPEEGTTSYTSHWLGPDGAGVVLLGTHECAYEITATARNTGQVDRVCEAELAWGDSPADGDYGRALYTTTRGANSTAQVRPVDAGTGGNCSAQPVLALTIDPADVVAELPASSTDSNLEARARRAVAVTEFRILVTPDSTTVNRSGCDKSLDFVIAGDGDAHKEGLGAIGSAVTCKFRIKVQAPAPFVVVDRDGEAFDTDDADTDGEIDIDLSDHVELPWNRIVIIQDVHNNPGNQGSVAYTVARECAGVAALPPIASATGGSGIYTLPGGQTVASLNEGRFTVHAPNFANFGAGAVYPAVATSTTSDTIAGCSVTINAGAMPAGCTLAGSSSRTLTWSAANPIQNFDFEFDIYCSGTQPPEPEIPPPAPPSDDDSAETETTTTVTAPEAATDTVRLVARLRDNGKIEFGLQQWQHDSSWSDRVFPRARLFPADTTVGRWLVSSAISLSVSDSASAFGEDTHVRIVARLQEDGRVEFGLQQSDDGGDTWGDRILPTRRYFPTGATVDRWLGSSNITVDS